MQGTRTRIREPIRVKLKRQISKDFVCRDPLLRALGESMSRKEIKKKTISEKKIMYTLLAIQSRQCSLNSIYIYRRIIMCIAQFIGLCPVVLGRSCVLSQKVTKFEVERPCLISYIRLLFEKNSIEKNHSSSSDKTYTYEVWAGNSQTGGPMSRIIYKRINFRTCLDRNLYGIELRPSSLFATQAAFSQVELKVGNTTNLQENITTAVLYGWYI